MDRTDWAKRLAVAAVTALVIVAGSAALPALLQPAPAAPVNTSEWDAGAQVEPLTREGEISPDVSGGDKTVVIDASHGNRYDEEELQPLVRTLVRKGYEVRFSTERNLSESLDDADALVVVDPASDYDEEDVEAITEFTDAGGRLLVLAEPNRKTVSLTPFGFAVTTVRSQVQELGLAYDVTVDSRYLWNQDHNDGSFKDPLGRAARGTDLPEGTYAFSTVAPVYAPGAERIVLAERQSRLSKTDEGGRFAVAVRRGNAIFVGDSSFLAAGNARLGDNEQLVAYLIEFLVSGDRVDRPDRDDDGVGDGVGGE